MRRKCLVFSGGAKDSFSPKASSRLRVRLTGVLPLTFNLFERFQNKAICLINITNINQMESLLGSRSRCLIIFYLFLYKNYILCGRYSLILYLTVSMSLIFSINKLDIIVSFQESVR